MLCLSTLYFHVRCFGALVWLLAATESGWTSPPIFYDIIISITFVVVAAQVNKVQINVTSPIQVDVDEFEITCHAQGSYHHIFSYAIHKNGSSGWSPVVRQYYTVGSITSMVKTEWFLSSFESRAILSGTPLPSPLATMKMTIPANKVNMATDAAEYQCDFVATQRSGNYPITHSDVAYIEILPGPTGHSSSKTTTPTSTAGNRLSFGRLNFAFLISLIILVKQNTHYI
ncbi:hypothetical protein FSP39_009908 [Pinctada imbricata]|uniref:Uncharacterized protein n=1 Tax=Pinctada imbricata TaxID=66713 RepID=A0AA88YKT1_PINIB|nr:hypothetical protein FSP39_009908 [Pinctada imbricata]